MSEVVFLQKFQVREVIFVDKKYAVEYHLSQFMNYQLKLSSI